MTTFDGNAVVRSTRGTCSTSEAGTPPASEVSRDGGAVWEPISFGSVDVREILSLEYVTDSQIDLIARTGPTCVVTMVTSFTGGEFWASYPDRTSESVFADPDAAGAIKVYGVETEQPCSDLVEVKGFNGGAVALCSDGIHVYSVAEPGWQTVTASPESAIAVAADGSQVMTAADGGTSCDGLRIQSIGLEAAPYESENLACISRGIALSDATLALTGTKAILWSSATVLTSPDQGVTWASVLEN
ncbi:MAG: hypothetical protein EPO52_00015 [Herbiconiux sp.]|uniref:hypothetical protein n=1 Tax=Herbiconiux sp. TaxID=1871186 RepID=UPI0011F780A3|nr:hypothetical protein [Herbiconiux sp.]TAJ50248.1 MAG: hypothetical protein EPO52_00015 [Herbiconiux sp.]